MKAMILALSLFSIGALASASEDVVLNPGDSHVISLDKKELKTIAKKQGSLEVQVSCVEREHPVDRLSDAGLLVLTSQGRVEGCKLVVNTTVFLNECYNVVAGSVTFPKETTCYLQKDEAAVVIRALVKDSICVLK